jgi:hypothetical protein
LSDQWEDRKTDIIIAAQEVVAIPDILADTERYESERHIIEGRDIDTVSALVVLGEIHRDTLAIIHDNDAAEERGEGDAHNALDLIRDMLVNQ